MSEWPTVKQIAAIERKDRKRDLLVTSDLITDQLFTDYLTSY
jgi:hypothetical protein